MFRLPVSQITVELGPFTGVEDMLLLERADGELELSVSLLNRLARLDTGAALDAASLPLTDLEALLLEVRRRLLGDLVRSRARCPAACGAETDISFRIAEYLEHHRPRMPRNCVPAQEAGWYRLRQHELEFRAITTRDLMAVDGAPNPKAELARRTIRPAQVSLREMNRVQMAMESLCPSLSRELEGRCPECGRTARFFFHARNYVLHELEYEAAFLYEDVHVLAARYHWSEEKIVSLPRSRRLQYTELALRGAN